MTITEKLSFPGTPLREDDVRSGRVLTIAGRANVEYRWDVGTAMAGYLDGLRRGVILGRLCPRCQRVLLPPRAFCEQCFAPTVRWVELGDGGTIDTFAICHIAWDATRIDTPQVPAVIAIDGAAPGMGMLHLVAGVDPGLIRVGQRVRAVWRPPAERLGSIADIAYFRPE